MKKFMALLATGLVMALSATTVFAAESVSLKLEEMNASKVTSGLDFDLEEVNVTTTVEDYSTINESEAKEILAAIENDNNFDLAGVEVKSYMNLVIELADTDGNPIKVSKYNPVYVSVDALGASADEKVKVFNYNEKTGEWEEVELVSRDGKLAAKFTHFSPVMVLSYTEEVARPYVGGWWYYDSAVDGPVNPATAGAASAATTSPKTGVVPVAAFAATICLAGAAVCGRKVK